jgi:hypothetical protein
MQTYTLFPKTAMKRTIKTVPIQKHMNKNCTGAFYISEELLC